MDDYHFISKCSENYLSDTRVTKVSLSVSAQGLRKATRKLQVQTEEQGNTVVKYILMKS